MQALRREYRDPEIHSIAMHLSNSLEEFLYFSSLAGDDNLDSFVIDIIDYKLPVSRGMLFAYKLVGGVLCAKVLR